MMKYDLLWKQQLQTKGLESMEQYEALHDQLKTAQYQFKHDENHRRATPAPLAIADGDVTGEGPKDDLADNMDSFWELCSNMVDSAQDAYKKTTESYKAIMNQPESMGRKLLMNQMEDRCLAIMSYLHSVSYSC